MAIQVKKRRVRKIRRNAEFLAAKGVHSPPVDAEVSPAQNSALSAAPGVENTSRPTWFRNDVEVEWDTPALNIPPITETMLTAEIIDIAPRPMAAMDSIWFE